MRVYLLGICGTAMAHVALLLREMGHSVCGADTHFYPPISTLLERSGIETFVGYDPKRLSSIKPDEVIVGNVVSRLNPEIEYLLRSRPCPFTSFPEFLHRQVLSNRYSIVVAGTHGKTTTTSLLAFLFRENGIETGYLVGGMPRNFPHGAALGNSLAPFILEGDEYDTAFFDKKSKFFHYFPRLLLLNNVEFDHGDIFASLREVQRAFYGLTRLVPDNGAIIYNGDDKNIKKLGPWPWTQTISVGFRRGHQWQIRNYTESGSGSHFELFHQGRCRTQINVPLRGEFNAHNAAMAVVASQWYGQQHQLPPIHTECLVRFKGVERRQSILWDTPRLTVVEDFAHHPTALKATLKAFKNSYPDRRIVACFEPACNTSASQYFEQHAREAFQHADDVWIAPPKSRLFSDKFIPPLTPLSVGKLVKKLSSEGRSSRTFISTEALQDHLKSFRPSRPTLLCFFSNGPLIHLTREFVNRLGHPG
jgi:UDP-N-acetylmuramate: L-alanyl-gamma-D-glutamyl-meso-diaminopimelate ligase